MSRSLGQTQRELVLIAVCFVLTVLLSSVFQKPLSFNDGKGWDGAVYYRMAEQFAGHELPKAGGPYVYRIGTPFLAALIDPSNLKVGFLIVNLLASIGVVVLLYFWLRLFLKIGWVRVMLVCLFITHWNAPVRRIFFSSIYVDPLMMLAILAGLILIHKLKQVPNSVWISAFSFVVFFGTLVREVVLLLPIALLFAIEPELPVLSLARLRNIRVSYWIPLLCGLAGLLLSHLLATQTNNYGVSEIIEATLEKRPWSYILGLFIAFGPILILPLFDFRRSWAYLKGHPDSLFCLAAFAAIGWIGGTDTERLLSWATPFVYVLTGIAIENNLALLRSNLFALVLLVGQFISQRIFWITPDFPNPYPSIMPILTPPANTVPYFDLFSEFSERSVRTAAVLEYLVLALGLILWLWYRRKKQTETN